MWICSKLSLLILKDSILDNGQTFNRTLIELIQRILTDSLSLSIRFNPLNPFHLRSMIF